MATDVWFPEEFGGRPAQVLDPRNASLQAFGVLAARVRSAWTAETAWIDEWDVGNPARGQCGTSTLVLQDEHGGRVVRGLVHETGRSAVPAVHYWNVVDGRHVDLTWQQFSSSAFVLRSHFVDRDELLVSRWFTDRYAILRRRMDVHPPAGSSALPPTGSPRLLVS